MNPMILVTEAITITGLFDYIIRNAFGNMVFAALILLAVICVIIYKANLRWSVAVISGFILFFGLFVTVQDVFVSMFAIALMLIFAVIGFAMLYFSRRG